MCPDPQLLSIYMDGELPSPWKEKLESHLSGCPACKEKFENYKHVRDLFKRGASGVPTEQRRTIVERDASEKEAQCAEGGLLESSKEKVWQKLAARRRFDAGGYIRKSGNIRGYGLWKRKINIPLPIAAAAALILVFGAVFLLRDMSSGNLTNYAGSQDEYQNFMLAAEDEILPVIPAGMEYMQDLNSVLQYLDSNGADIIILQLPESRNFSRSGEPIIRSADYTQTRRQP